jgi:hypothetical protein
MDVGLGGVETEAHADQRDMSSASLAPGGADRGAEAAWEVRAGSAASFRAGAAEPHTSRTSDMYWATTVWPVASPGATSIEAARELIRIRA